ncbi:pentatricopeptide repeat-containing protein At3g12770-like [Humulus lupulus]|uniref:pentatricopeptide repeat-containing protein At3g12770-like n=1 Tax=Humulus lupulus TaxID=3486 RepID=UPI002B40E218|nr:pentatricopeptide repeat-containing protein At3g12770-like [Humulus lupulus]
MNLSYRNCTSAAAFDQVLSLLRYIKLSIVKKSLKLNQKSHARVLILGLSQNPFLATKLMSAYSAFGNLIDSQLVFQMSKHKNVYLWNTLINGYVRNSEYTEAFEYFKEMCHGDLFPDDYTLATMAKVSGEMGNLVAGKLVHGRSVRVGFVFDIVVSNSLMSMYSKCLNFGDCRKVFDEMPLRNVGSWSVLLAGYVGCGKQSFDQELLELIKCMQIDGLKPDGFTVSSILPLCGVDSRKWPDYGGELHCYIVRNGLYSELGSDVHLGCCLIDMYLKSGRIVEGRRVFNQMNCRNVYTWTAIINGYTKNGASDEALNLFHEMQVKDGIEPNRVSLLSVLPACNSHACLRGGKQIHGFAIRKLLNHDVSLCNALIDMYSKCGSLDLARRVFEDESFCKDAISWTSMISGYGLHGRGKEALSLYDKMVLQGIRLDTITVVGILSACGRSGLIDEGLKIYDSVVNEHGIKPTVEICACVVDMLGRSGQLDRALDFIRGMTVQPGPSVWGALVAASVLHGNSKMQELAYRFLIELEPKNPSNFISLSNLYASSKQWDVVAEVRTKMKERGMRKEPGCSWISINSTTHCFYVADKVHPCSHLIYEMLENLIFVIKGANHSSDNEIQT